MLPIYDIYKLTDVPNQIYCNIELPTSKDKKKSKKDPPGLKKIGRTLSSDFRKNIHFTQLPVSPQLDDEVNNTSSYSLPVTPIIGTKPIPNQSIIVQAIQQNRSYSDSSDKDNLEKKLFICYMRGALQSPNKFSKMFNSFNF